jgi:Domain of unknown function (DUF1963)
MFSMIEIGSICDDSADCKFGGIPALPSELKWPLDSEGQPLLHLITIPGRTLNHYANLTVDGDTCLSVFVPFKAGDIKRGIQLARESGASQVFLYKQLGESSAPPKSLSFGPFEMIFVEDRPDNEDEEEFSGETDDKIGGHAIWLQRRIDLPKSKFVLQINERLLTESCPELAGIFVGGMGFLFIDVNAQPGLDSIGELRVQFT